MNERKLCRLQDLKEGEMTAFDLGAREVIVLWPAGGEPRAYDGACPHQGISLGFGEFDGRLLVCGAHQWSFDASTGQGVMPPDCRLKALALRIEGGDVMLGEA